ncbi:ATP12-domain-containing protein [Epithele typhae]|uniref:ATP12-domain-containing protein n=1 Tax=Epithele typhae TaxID=378194 RepID=UPI00200827CE|nr:ATP12-domain-containing protein [Epithele typhae]KAH9923933.1 ATP12-domain-containing protein [Epithele typhae]
MFRHATRAFSPLARHHAPRPHTLKQAALSARRYATAPDDGPAVTATNRAEATLKRFWKDVGIEKRDGGYAVTLDRRALKTPGGRPLVVPAEKRLVAALVASEWENQTTVLKPHALPMTSIASRALDAFEDEGTRAEIRAQLLKYFGTDTVCYHADAPATLVKLQAEHWQPILDWAVSMLGIDIAVSTSFAVPKQSPETIAKLDEILKGFSSWEMAAMERATYTSKSFLVGLALVMGRIDVDQAAQAAHVEVNSQIERWGEVEDSHDVDFHDIRRQLGSASCLLADY